MLNPKLFSDIYPINKVEIFFDEEDHSDYMGFEWELISKGLFPVGLDKTDPDFNSVGKIDGEKTHKLTEDEIGEHTHYMVGDGTSDSSAGDIDSNHPIAAYATSTASNLPYSLRNNTSKVANKGLTSKAGGGQAHNNLPPYIVMAFWKRIA